MLVFIDLFQHSNAVTNLAGWGRLLMKVMDNWDFGECAKMFDAVLHFDDNRAYNDINILFTLPFGNHYHHIVHMILSHLGTDKNLELKVRTFLRHIFLDHRFTDIRDYPFWLSVTLHMRSSAIERAHLLMLLYAPLKASTVTANGCIFVFYFSISNKTHSI